MTAGELIVELQKYPPTALIMIEYESIYEPVDGVFSGHVRPTTGADVEFAPYKKCDANDPNAIVAAAVYIL